MDLRHLLSLERTCTTHPFLFEWTRKKEVVSVTRVVPVTPSSVSMYHVESSPSVPHSAGPDVFGECLVETQKYGDPHPSNPVTPHPPPPPATMSNMFLLWCVLYMLGFVFSD